MAQGQPDNHDAASTGQTPEQTSSLSDKKPSRTMWIIILVFIPSFLFATSLIIKYYRGDPTDWWIKDYNAGIALAKQENKPALLCFFKQGTRFSSDMWQGVYSRPELKRYIEAHYVPILIDVDKQPEIAKRYNVTYYPTHYVIYPDTNQKEGPFIGAHRLVDFIQNPREFGRKSNSSR